MKNLSSSKDNIRRLKDKPQMREILAMHVSNKGLRQNKYCLQIWLAQLRTASTTA